MENEVTKSQKVGKPISFEVGAVEIYCEQVRDLLGDDDNLEVRGTGKNVFCAGQTWVKIANMDEFMKAIKTSQSKRVFKANAINQRSSRSHHVF